MRIGEFAVINNLSIDTIRYYTELNLIHPIRKGKYFYFEKEQQEQLDKILPLKNLDFTLDEIKRIINLEKLCKIETKTESRLYEEMLMGKKRAVEEQIEHLNQVLCNLESELEHVHHDKKSNEMLRGVAFNYLSLLCCPKCGKDVEFTEGILKNNRLYHATGVCSCGFPLIIHEGILSTKEIKEANIDEVNYIDDFMKETPKSFIDFMMKNNEEVSRILVEKELSTKVLLFYRTGFGPVELHLLEKTTDIKLLIVVDQAFEKLKIAKKSIENNFPQMEVLYICGDLKELPLKPQSIDVGIDFLATIFYGFETDDDFYPRIMPILKEKSWIVGLYMYFKKADMFSRIPKSRWNFFDKRSIINSLLSYHYSETGHYEEEVLHEGSNINDFFLPNDKVYAQLMIFERK